MSYEPDIFPWKYLGRRWSEDCDCYGWFREIQRAEFGREIEKIEVDHSEGRFLLDAARSFSEEMAERLGFRQTDEPETGDAAWLTQRKKPHHLGMVVILDGELCVLHALEGVGVVLSDQADLAANNWRIWSFWAYAG